MRGGAGVGARAEARWCRKTGPHSAALACYVELDFPENTSKKAMAIRKSRELSAVLGAPETISVGACQSLTHTSHLVHCV
jgi:[phosphatase 2A protein]-leucine-carboxy methyltransferase